MNKIIGYVLLVLAAATVACMIINVNEVWFILNYVMVAVLLISGIVLLRQK